MITRLFRIPSTIRAHSNVGYVFRIFSMNFLMRLAITS